ncbi:NADPH-dependent F420 reductase [Streptomyces thermocarboxydovorans]|uniref:NADPH-dependent F420 reductase n=1 Tax=Streptomyces thermocarboxydovorans TaxID=59298 RepID=A0ABN1HS43_9ACTN
MQSQTYSIGVIGGTGPQGKGLAYRFARAGHRVFLGSRSPERAQEAAQKLNARLPADQAVSGTSNATAASVNEVVLLAVPWNGHTELVADLRDHLAGKIVISCVNPLGFDKRGPYGLPVSDGSAAEQAAGLLPDSRVVGAFHHVSAVSLLGDAEYLKDEDVLVCGDDAAAKGVVQELVRAVTGRIGVDAGALRLARQLEPLTAVLISINKKYKTHSGLAVTGLTRSH